MTLCQDLLMSLVDDCHDAIGLLLCLRLDHELIKVSLPMTNAAAVHTSQFLTPKLLWYSEILIER